MQALISLVQSTLTTQNDLRNPDHLATSVDFRYLLIYALH